MTALTALFYGPQPIRMWPGTDAFRRIVSDPAWAVEPKLDDWRCFVGVGDGTLAAWSNSGRPLALPADAARGLLSLGLPPGTALDGCLIGKRGGAPAYVAFDGPIWAGRPADDGLDARRARLEAHGVPLVGRLPNDPSAFGAALAMSDPGTGLRVEGIVMKRRAAPYPAHRRPRQDTADWIKVKVQSRWDAADGRIRAVAERAPR